MPKLTQTDDELHISLKGATDFQMALAQVKAVPGRRFDPDTKLWKFPRDPSIAERLLLTLKPTADAAILAWVRATRAERDASLTTKIPDDADDLLIPWADKLFPFQRAFVRFAIEHPKIIEADDMGLGKSVQSLSVVSEWVLRFSCEQNQDTTHTDSHARTKASVLSRVSREEPRENSTVQQAIGTGTSGQMECADSSGEGQALRGLRDSASQGMYGPGSCSREKAIHVRELSELSSAEGHDSHTSNSSRIEEMRGSLSNVPSLEALAGKPKLVIAPASAKGVWAREIEKWLPAGTPYTIVDAKTAKKRESQLVKGITAGGYCIVNWEQINAVQRETTKTVHHRDGSTSERDIRWMELKQPLFGETDWLAIIADEAHRAKSRKALRTQGLWMLSAPIQIAATGTPLMNAPDELWSILKWLYPEQYGKSTPGHPRTAYWSFHDQYTESYEGYKGSKVVVGVRNPDALRFELKDRLVRRTKAEKLNLPEKTREYVPLTMNPEQAKIYASAEADFWLTIEQSIKQGDKKESESAKRFLDEVLTGKKRIFEIPNGAARTVRLRQVLCTPKLLGGVDDSCKLDAIQEIILDNSHKQHVVFTEFVEGANILVERLRKKGATAEAFTGEVTDTAIRTHYEDRFQQGHIDVLVGTLGAMREAITLTAADTVHFCERSWVPAHNHQAEDRLHRTGQSNPVTILIYTVEDTVDTDKVEPTNQLKELIVSSVIKQDEIAVAT